MHSSRHLHSRYFFSVIFEVLKNVHSTGQNDIARAVYWIIFKAVPGFIITFIIFLKITFLSSSWRELPTFPPVIEGARSKLFTFWNWDYYDIEIVGRMDAVSG